MAAARCCARPGASRSSCFASFRSFACRDPLPAFRRWLWRSAFSSRRCPISPSPAIFSFTPGGASFFFNRLVEDGIVTRYLDKSCPDPTLRICAYRADISTGYDDWLWKNDTPFWKLGGWQGYSDEQRRIILATLVSDPARASHHGGPRHAAAVRLLQDRGRVPGGRKRLHDRHHPRTPAVALSGVDGGAPAGHAVQRSARSTPSTFRLQGCRSLDSSACCSFAGICPTAPSALAATAVFALIINAAVCGVFSHAADRYQSRLVPIAPLALMIVALSRRRRS